MSSGAARAASAALPGTDDLAGVPLRSRAEEQEFVHRYPRLAGLVEKRWLTPGLLAGYVPQGLAWAVGQRCLLIAMHCARKERPSLIITVDSADGGLRGAARLRDTDGSPHVGHVGGLAIIDDSVFVTSGTGNSPLGVGLRFSLSSVMSPGRDGVVAEAAVVIDARGSFMTADGGDLWVGDFWRPEGNDHRTAQHHHHDQHRGWVAAHHVGDGGAASTPHRALFIPSCVQGVAFVGEMIMLSRSWGSSDSHLERHRLPARPWRERSLANGETVAVDSLGDRTLVEVVSMPAGAQGITWTGSLLLTVFEGGATRYRDRWRSDGAVIEDSILGLRLPESHRS